MDKGVLAIFIGVAFLSAPLFLGNSPMLRSVSQGLKVPALFALGIGIVLVVLHRLVQGANAAKLPPLEPSSGPRPA